MDSKKTITNEIFGSVSGSGGGASTSPSGTFAFTEQFVTTTTFLANGASSPSTDKQFTISLYKLGNIVFCRIKRNIAAMSSVRVWEIVNPIRMSMRPAAKTTYSFLPVVGVESYDSDITGAVTISPNGQLEISRKKMPGTGAWDGSACGWDDLTFFWLTV